MSKIEDIESNSGRRTSEGEDNDEDPLVIDEDKPNEGNDEDSPLIIDENKQKQKEVTEGDEGEKEFEPTVDMMMNEFDDERTMEEEEALDQEDEAEELNALTKEQDIPLEELLKLYGYNQAAEKEADKEEPEEEEMDEEITEDSKPEDVDEIVEEESILNQNKADEMSEYSENEFVSKGEKRGSMSPPPAKKSKSELARFYEAAIEGRSLRSTTQDDEDDESGEEVEGENKDYSWKKTIMIGPSYQATVPTGLQTYDDTPPYENEDKKLWDPYRLAAEVTEEYLAKSAETLGANGTIGVSGIPNGSHIRDDEQALYLLLQCGHSTEEALRRRRLNAVPAADTMSLWSEEECRAFETGLRVYGKDFHSIKAQKVGTRSVGELVQFYYLWKKTERHDVFANSFRIEKKKYTLHPGQTDYMERFVDENLVGRDRSASPNCHSLIYGGLQRTSESEEKLDPNGSNEDGDMKTESGEAPQDMTEREDLNKENLLLS